LAKGLGSELSVSADGEVDPRIEALAAFQRRRRKDSRERLLGAATTLFCDRGYFAVSVDEVASAAGLSRMTFYRHFSSKADLAAHLFKLAAEAAMPRFLAIATMDLDDRDSVVNWITTLFGADRADRRLLRVFTQAMADEEGFTERAQELIRELISKLGGLIPAFAVDPERPDQRRQWLEAWLLIYEVLDQSNHAALDSGVATDPLIIGILADRFMQFVRQYATTIGEKQR
jgi:AcrR family transcriptional regulator